MKNKALFAACVLAMAVVTGCGAGEVKDNGKNNSTVGGVSDEDSSSKDKGDDTGSKENESKENGDEQDSAKSKALEGYIGNVVSEEYILYKEGHASNKTGEVESYNYYDYDSNWNTIWSGYYRDEAREEMLNDHYYFNLYNGDETVPTDKSYDEGYVWDANGNKIKHIKSGKVAHTYVYDSDNHLKETHAVNANGYDTKVTYYEYDANGNCVKESEMTVSKGYVSIASLYIYDEKGNVTEVDVQYYKEDGSLKDEDHGVSGTWQYEYDEYGRIIRMYKKLENGGTYFDCEYEYDEVGHLVMIHDVTFRKYSYYCNKSEFVHLAK